ncbi:MAG: LysR family transcriptional regulator [Anaerolineae bacterium]|nr:LysR family transcriptional regulator [Anaerolineae bacterium]
MEIGQLEAFERVAREGNFTRAADSLRLTQPAVSTRISLLEAELGGKLFDRRGRQLVLTSLGERFLPYAQRILSLREAGLEAVRQFRTGVSGQVRMGAPTPLLLSYMVDALMRFRQTHPAVDLNIRERDKATIVQMIADNALTLGLVYHPVFDSSMQHLLRFRDPIVPIVGTYHPLAEQTHRQLRMEDLYEHTVFRVSMFPQMSAFIDEVVEHSRGGSGGAVIAVPMVMARRLVMMGQGVTFLPSSYVRAPIESGEFVQLNITDMPTLYSEPIVIARQGRELDEAHSAFIEVLRYQWRHWLA